MRVSIKVTLALIYVSLIAATLLSCWIVNISFLEKYYEDRKRDALMEVYNYLDTAFDWDSIEIEALQRGSVYEDDLGSDWDDTGFLPDGQPVDGSMDDAEGGETDHDTELQRLCTRYNISFMILGANGNVLKASMYNVRDLRRQLFDNIFSMNNTGVLGENVLEANENYILQTYSDQRSQSVFTEVWGFLSSGKLFIIRTPRESIQESAHLANRFMLRVGIAAVIIGAVIIFIVTDKITKPLRELTAISEKMAQLDFDTKYIRDENDINDEISDLGENMNTLSETLEKTISELKSANLELKKDVERKEHIDNMRREFLSNVSHELKTPIALIQGYAEGLQESVNDDDGSREFYCEVIMDEASRMNRLVQNLLNIDNIESGAQAPVMERFDLADMIHNMIQSTDILFKQNSINVVNDIDSPLYIWADKLRCEDILRNYISNAIHHCSLDNTIHLKSSREDSYVKVSVFNSGQPIPEESLPHIWDKFYKVDKARTREYGGSGVGLSIVKAACDSMGQNYGADNYENGVEFWVTFQTSI